MRNAMDEHIYKIIHVVGSSDKSADDAIRNAITKASETIKGLRWFEVAELRGDIHEGQVAHFQATLKIGFRLMD
jgi:flavin-binding protein dodecin